MLHGITRRKFLQRAALVSGGAVAVMAGCQPKIVEVTKVVEKVVKETVMVEGTPQVVEKVVKETVVVQKEVTAVAKPTEVKQAQVTCIWRNNPNEKRTMEEAWARYKEIKPNVDVEYLVVPAGNEGEQKLLSLFAAGEPPEVYASVFSAGLVDYYYRGMVADFVPYIERDKYDQTDFSQTALDTFTFGAKQVGMPRGGIATCLFCNLELFEEAGIEPPPTNMEDADWTWDKMVEIARMMTKDLDGDGRVDQYGLIFGNFNYNQFPMLWDKSIFPPEHFKYGITKSHNLRDETVIQSFQRGADLIWQNNCAPSPEASEALAALSPGGPFLSGRVAMWANLAGPTSVKDAPFKTGIASFPRGAANLQQRAMTWTGPLCMGRNCQEPEEGWRLISWLCGEEGQRIIAPGAFIGTSRTSLQEWWAGLFNLPPADVLSVEQQGYKYGVESPNVRTVGWPEVSQMLRSALDPLWIGEKTAEECLLGVADTLETKVTEIYEANRVTAAAIFPGFGD
jgi:multiple sugar transport system substrate-binding protein